VFEILLMTLDTITGSGGSETREVQSECHHQQLYSAEERLEVIKSG
jgi:hypothetical protein